MDLVWKNKRCFTGMQNQVMSGYSYAYLTAFAPEQFKKTMQMRLETVADSFQ